MSYFFDTYYQGTGKKFHNIFQALEHQQSTGEFCEFVLDPELIKNITSIERPKNITRQYMQDLMVRRLKDLRQKYDKIKFLYSGGTDSYTMLKLCMDNDIFVDETITQMTSPSRDVRSNLEYLAGLKLAKPYEGKGIGKCIELHPTMQDTKFVDDDDWYLDETLLPGSSMPFRPYHIAKMVTQHTEPNTIFLMGYEKPRFIYKENKIYWTQEDGAIGEIMGSKNVVPFWLDKDNPELVVALAYAMLDVVGYDHKGLVKYNALPATVQKKLLHQSGFYETPYNFINTASTGKGDFNMNSKNKRFLKEMQNTNKDFVTKMLGTHARIRERYGDQKYGIEVSSDGKLIKPLGKFSQPVIVGEKGLYI